MMDAIAGFLLKKVADALVNEAQSLLAFDEQFEGMTKEVQYMQGFLKDAEGVDPNYQAHVLRMIMNDLKDILFDTDDIIADSLRLSRRQRNCVLISLWNCVPILLRKCVPIFLSPSTISSHYKLGQRLQEVRQNMEQVNKRMKIYMNAPLRLPGPSKRESQNPSWSNPILIDEINVVGLDGDAEKIIGWVLEADIPIQVIGIAGMGGVGKTTLAEKVCKSRSIIEIFDCVLFVSISQQVNLENVISNLLRKFRVNEDSLRGDIRNLLEMLRKKLNGQRYLIVLDDVWGINEGTWWWSSLESFLPKTHGSCVIVTSRKDDVIKQMGTAEERIHHPEVLSVKDSWLLFSKIAFAGNGGECPNPKLKDIGEKIVKKCAGLPLAIKTIGGTMLGKGNDVDEWDGMLKRLNEKLTDNMEHDPVMPRLRLSYEELPSYLKPCLLCFAAFPEDAVIDMREITWWWIGEGFVREWDGRSAMDIGRDYLAQLLSRSLIMGVEKNMFETYYTSFKVHDIIREMLVQIAREENFIGLDDDTDRPIISKPPRRDAEKDIEDFETSPKLRVLVNYGRGNKLSSTVKQKLCQLQWLRVLHLRIPFLDFDSDSDSDYDSEERKGLQFIMKKLEKQKKMKRGQILSLRLRQVFLSLPHLVSLVIDGGGFDEIPDSIGRLHNLKILIVRHCHNLLRVSPEITTLKKLIILEIRFCPSLECIPRGIGKLSGLQWLRFEPTNYLAHKDGCRLSELKNLTRLHRLSLEILSEDQIEEGELNALAELSCLHELHIFCRRSFTSKLDQWLSCPLHHLSYVNLVPLAQKATPTWLNPIVLPNLRFLRLCGREIVQFSQEFWEDREGIHWKLEGLILDYLPNLDEEWPRIQRAMPSLTFLSVKECPHLKSLPPVGGETGIWRKEELRGEGSSAQMHSASGFE